MKWFTPELLCRCNHYDDAVITQAALDLASASIAYKKHRKKISSGLPYESKISVNKLCLIKCEVIAEFHDYNPNLKPSKSGRFVGTLTLVVEDFAPNYCLLAYDLLERVTITQHKGDVFSLGNPSPSFWLHDEFDFEKMVPIHRILLEDGRELRIPFFKLRVLKSNKPVVKQRGRKWV